MSRRTRETDTRFDALQPTDVVRVPVTLHWLCAPTGLLFVLPLPALIGSLLIPDDQYLPMFGQPVFLDDRLRIVALSYMAILFVVFTLAVPMRGYATSTIDLDARARRWLNHSIQWLAVVTFGAYAVWLGNALLRGLNSATVIALLTGEQGAIYTLRDQYFENLSGVTTWMQLGALVVPLAVLRAKSGGRSARSLLTALFLLAGVRALLNAERLALIEILLSTVLAYALLRPAAPAILRRPGSAVLLTVGGWAALVLVFAGFEFFRSWTYEQGSSSDFWAYAITLLIGYYATALNLAAFDSMMLAGNNLPSELFQGNLWEQLFGPSPIDGAQKAYGLATFTNRSGLLVPEVAFGTLGGALVILLTAITIATLARNTAKGHVVAYAMYCCLAVAVLEFVRIYYFGSSRFLPVLVASTVLAVSWSLSRSRRAGRRKEPAHI